LFFGLKRLREKSGPRSMDVGAGPAGAKAQGILNRLRPD
jgi:hypothetical protein